MHIASAPISGESFVIASNTERLLGFFASWNTDFFSFCRSFEEIFTPDTVWENSGLPTVTGYEQALEQILKPSNAQPLGMDAIGVDMLNIAESRDGKVLHERVDHLLRADKSLIISIQIAGITEFSADGKIKAWRDYTDPTPLLALMAAG
jgi:limonene-1,2-epoxide hydrolase